MKYYIATGFANKEQHNHLMRMLEKRGHAITFDWTREEPAVPRGPSVSKRISEMEISGVVNADVVFLLLPGGKGTHVELGAALATNTPVILVELQDYSDVVHKPSIFYFHGMVFRSLNFTSAITHAEYMFSKMMNTYTARTSGMILDPTHDEQDRIDEDIFQSKNS